LSLEPLEERSLPSGNPAPASAYKNPPSPMGTVFSTDANVNIDVGGLIHEETTVAVNPTNPLNMIASANDYEGGVNNGGQIHYATHARARVTFDGGQTWTTYAVPTNAYELTGDPSVSFDADGTAYLATQARVFSQNGAVGTDRTGADIIVSHSTDGGQTWAAPVRVATGKGADGAKVQETNNDKPYLTAWGHGNAIATWTQFNWGPQGVFIDQPVLASVTHDGGMDWTAPAQLSGPLDFGAVPTVAADGSVYVGYQSYDNAVGPEFRHHYEVVKVDPATGQPLAAPVVVGVTYDGIHDCPLNVNGYQTYQDSEFRAPSGMGNVTADPTNASHLAVIWPDMRNNPYPDAELPSSDPYQVRTNSDIIVSQSFDGGLTWSAPAALALANDQFQPWGAYDTTGRLQIGFYDRSYDPANHQYGYTLASETAPGALTFTFRQVTTALSDPTQGDAFFTVTVNPAFPNATTFLGDYTGIAVTPTGVAAVWTDLRLPSTSLPGSGEDVFFAFVGSDTYLADLSAALAAAESDPSAPGGHRRK
jgi:hypothetical protein